MAFSLYDICSKNLTKSHRHPYGIRSDGVRNPIGRRTESDWTAYANGGTLRGCTCLRSALPLARARSAPTEQEMYPLQVCQNYNILLLSGKQLFTLILFCCSVFYSNIY